MEKILSWLNDFKSFFSSEVSKISSAQAELVTVRAELATAKSDLTAAQATISSLQKCAAAAGVELTAKDSEITRLTSELATEKNRATETLAAQGVRPEDLPAGSTENSGAKSVSQQVDALRKKLSSSTDPKEKFQLSNQIRELLSAKN
jgi:chromosome segregation ATPase